MEIRSRRQFQVRAVTAGTMRLTFLLPSDRFWTRDIVILGVTNFARAGKIERLDWPPQTLFAEYNSTFTKNSGALGYAKPVAMKGMIMRSHLINNNADREFANRNRQQLTGAETRFFKSWLTTRDHPDCPDWSQQVRQLSSAVQRYSTHKMDLDALLHQFESRFVQGSPHQIHRTKTLMQQARSIAAKFERKLDARVPVAYLLLNAQNVTHYLYRDERDLLFNTDAEDAKHRKAGDFNRFMFTRVKQQKAEFAQRGIPFYDPDWLNDQHARHQPVWELSQLDAYHLGG